MQNASAVKSFKNRSDLHLARKIWHIITVSMMFLVWVLTPTWMSYLCLFMALILFLPLDFIRQFHKGFNEWVLHAFRAIIRESEVNKLAGTTYLLIGVSIIALLFSHHIVALSLLFLALADPIASYVGIRYGRDKIFRHKSVQGTLAAYLVCLVLSFLFSIYLGVSWDRALVFSILAGAVGALAELVPFGKIDDNLTLPIFSAIGLKLLSYFFLMPF